MLTGKQKRYLRGLGHNLNAIFQIGKDGVHQNQIDYLAYVIPNCLGCLHSFRASTLSQFATRHWNHFPPLQACPLSIFR